MDVADGDVCNSGKVLYVLGLGLSRVDCCCVV